MFRFWTLFFPLNPDSFFYLFYSLSITYITSRRLAFILPYIGKMRENEETKVKGIEKGLLKSLLFFSLILCVALSLPLSAGEENQLNPKAEKNTVENSLPLKNSPQPEQDKSLANTELFQMIQKENIAGKIESALHNSNANFIYEPNKILKNHLRVQSVERSIYTTTLVSLVGLNVADYFSTKQALKYDALKEGNPLLEPLTKNSLLFAAAKLGLTAYSYHFMQKLYKKNKTVAWAVSIAANLALSYIVSNNMKIISEQKTH